MGAENSKESSTSSQHVFAESAPTSFSPSLVNSLDTSNHSDATRASNLELKIQSRLQTELERISGESSSKLKLSMQKHSDEDADESTSSAMDKISELTGSEDKSAKLSSRTVSQEIQDLKKKLEGRKKLDKLDPSVEKARDNLVQCLRTNDRKSLNCWEEREAFKKEVSRLEKRFVEKTIQ